MEKKGNINTSKILGNRFSHCFLSEARHLKLRTPWSLVSAGPGISKFLEPISIFSEEFFFSKNTLVFYSVFNSVPETFCYGPEKSVKAENFKKNQYHQRNVPFIGTLPCSLHGALHNESLWIWTGLPVYLKPSSSAELLFFCCQRLLLQHRWRVTLYPKVRR